MNIGLSFLYARDKTFLCTDFICQFFLCETSLQAFVSYHLQQINDSGELHLSDGYKKYLYGSEKWSDEAMYNLDAVIAVGYRVNSYEATQFRIWATNVLKEFLTKGFVLDNERLKGQNVFGADYFDDLLDRIREIMSDFDQQLKSLFEDCN